MPFAGRESHNEGNRALALATSAVSCAERVGVWRLSASRPCERLDRLFLIHNEFVNTMSQKPVVRQLLPVVTEDEDKLQKLWDYIYEPSAAELLDGVLMRYIESQVYQGAVENVGCEMAARMVAMKSATDNAGELIDELQLIYNKVRQAAITKEISEIVGGAAAV